MMTRFLAKRISKAGVIESVIVILVLSIISAVMFPRFMRSQTMVRIHHNEKELQWLLENIQSPDFQATGMAIIPLNRHSPEMKIFSGVEFCKIFPEYSIYSVENDVLGFVHLGVEPLSEQEKMDENEPLPFGVFYITNHQGTKSDAAKFFISKTISIQKKLDMYKNPNSIPFRIDTIRIHENTILQPQPKMYFSVTNGLDSTGMIYFDNQGRSWRDGQR